MLGCAISSSSFAGEMTPLSGIPVIEDIKPLTVGDKVPQFVVDDVYGKEFDTAKKFGKANYIFVFWSIFCEPCKEEMPLIKLLTDTYDRSEVTVVAINLDGAPFKNAIKGYAKDGEFTFTFIIDELDEEEFFKIADPYGVAGTPTVYVIDKKGIVQFADVGKVKRSVLKEAIEGVINQ
jgi:thiol-disulfide isomerase/thioredoxin